MIEFEPVVHISHQFGVLCTNTPARFLKRFQNLPKVANALEKQNEAPMLDMLGENEP